MSEAAPATKFIPYRPHHGGQRQFHDARSKRRRFMACGARFGKDRALVNETLRVVTTMAKLRLQSGNIYSLVPLVHAWVVAPDYPRVEQFWRELKHFTPDEWIVRVHDSRKWVELRVQPNGPAVILIEMKSAKDPESLVGSGLDLLVITEAGLVKDIAWDAYLQPRLFSPGRHGMVIAAGTPKGRNWFFREFQNITEKMRREGDACDSWAMQAPTWMNPYVDRQRLREAWDNMPDLARRQEIKAEFVGASGGVFFGVRDAVVDPRLVTVSLPLVLGIDWGKRRDATVFSLLEFGGQMMQLERLFKVGYVNQLELLDDFIAQIFTDYGIESQQLIIAPERNSMGEVLCEQLQRKYGDQVWPFWTGAPSKRDMIDRLAVDIQTRGVGLLDDQQLLNELEIFEWGYTSAGNLVYHAPDEAGAYDDCVMSTAIANAVRHDIMENGLVRKARYRAVAVRG